jgi:tRNA-splicing ligase RtcB
LLFILIVVQNIYKEINYVLFMEFKKLNENTWEIEREGRMRVPAVIFASKQLLSDIQNDKTLEQLKNVSMLKGIIKNALVMPDAHQGYGFPIGGVAAFDIDEGIISPGGVGYDINCLHPSSKVLTSLGYTKEIWQFENDFNENLCNNGTCLLAGHSVLKSGYKDSIAMNFMYKNTTGELFNISTIAGTIKLTIDHPIITPYGKLLPTQLKIGSDVLVYPFEGVDYKYYSSNENELALYAKLLGYNTGNGNITLSRGKYRVSFFGKKQDMTFIQKDISSLGFNSKIFERTRKYVINGKVFISTSSELHVYSQCFAERLIALGGVVGNKTKVPFNVPDWIKYSPLWIKRLYLASFFGAELSKTSNLSKTTFYMPCLSINKTIGLEENLKSFLFDLVELLKSFDVLVKKVAKVETKGEKVRYKLEISGAEENIDRLYSKIGYEYNESRTIASLISVLYIRSKNLFKIKRDEIKTKIKYYKSLGFSLKTLKEKFVCSYVNLKFIERAYYEDKSVRISFDFTSFEDYFKYQFENYNLYGAFVSKIIDLSVEDYNGLVYDFSVNEIHRFVAQGTVVSNCGVRLLTTNYKLEKVLEKRKELLNEFFKNIPTGVGREGITKLSRTEFDEILKSGARWTINNNYGTEEDLLKTEEDGCSSYADISAVSQRAIARGIDQLGTLGSGNHFLEIQKVDKVYDKKVAEVFGIREEGQITVMIHCGSRGLGHQIASDYIKLMEDKYGFEHLPDRELACAPIKSDLGQKYYKAMCCAMNFAFANRQMIAHWVRESCRKVLGDGEIRQVYDVCHNIAKFEKHNIDGKMKTVCIHRKGATRSFGPGREEIPEVYRKVGQPVIIPGSMGTASYLLVGTSKAEEVSFGSTAHGAGRVMSRHGALKEITGQQVQKNLEDKNILVKGTSWKGLAEETPEAYKDIDEVIRISDEVGIGKKVARLIPLAVMKG